MNFSGPSIMSLCLFPLPSRGKEWTPGKGKGGDRSRTPFKGKGNKGKGQKGKLGKGKKGQANRQQSPWGQTKRPSMPKELRHLPSQDDKGRRYCYGCNLEEGCDLPTSGFPPECERGPASLHGLREQGARCVHPANKKPE